VPRWLPVIISGIIYVELTWTELRRQHWVDQTDNRFVTVCSFPSHYCYNSNSKDSFNKVDCNYSEDFCSIKVLQMSTFYYCLSRLLMGPHLFWPKLKASQWLTARFLPLLSFSTRYLVWIGRHLIHDMRYDTYSLYDTMTVRTFAWEETDVYSCFVSVIFFLSVCVAWWVSTGRTRVANYGFDWDLLWGFNNSMRNMGKNEVGYCTCSCIADWSASLQVQRP